MPPGKQELAGFIEWQDREMARAGVELVLGREATAEAVLDFDPDVVIAAIGAQELGPESLPFGAGGRFVMSEAVLRGEVAVQDPVFVISGDGGGAEVAHALAEHDHRVTLLEAEAEVAPLVPAGPRAFLLQRMEELGIRMLTGHRVEGVDAEGIFARHNEKETRFDHPGTVVLAIGRRPRERLIEQLEDSFVDVVVVGDAKQVWHAQAAVYQGAAAGREV
jgi:2-enoate reductase